MDGCSQPLTLLSGDAPNSQNSFFAPSVYTLTKVDSRPVVRPGRSCDVPVDPSYNGWRGAVCSAWHGIMLCTLCCWRVHRIRASLREAGRRGQPFASVEKTLTALQGSVSSHAVGPRAELPAHLPAPPLLQLDVVVMNSEGTVVVPSTQDGEAAGGGGGAQPNATDWQGCILVEDAVADGKVAATLDGVPSTEDCCRACKVESSCNVWNWCPPDQLRGCT